MDPNLRQKLIKLGASGASAVVIAVALVSHYEGRRYVPYLDPVGIPTVCAGITGADVVWGRRYTPAECDELEAKHLRIAEQAVKRLINNYENLERWQQAALLDFTFNTGSTALAGSTLRKMFNSGNVVGGCNELLKWKKARVKGQLTVLAGLVKRRDAENELCLYWKD